MTDRLRYQKVREEDRRAKISITRCLSKLFEIEKELEEDEKSLNVPALRLRADISMNLLKKRLPDLKAIEHSGSIGDRPLEEMTDVELAGELSRVRELIEGGSGKTKRKKQSPRVH